MKKKGFTLVELLVVIILIGLICLITIPMVSNILSNSKKEAFKRSIEGLAREYEYKELSDNIKLGEIDACTFQDTCNIQGTIKRNEDGNVVVYVTDGTYCTNGKASNIKVVRGTCGLNGESLSEITFNDKVITKYYEEITKDIELEVSGGSSGYTFTKVSETKDNVSSNSIVILNDGILRIPAKTGAGEYNLVVKVLDNVTQEEKEANIKIIINRIDITEITLNNIESVNYDGTEHEPEPPVVLNGKVLEKDIEYEYSYENNKNAGTATLTVTGIGNYVGEITKTFTINRVDAVNSEIFGSTLTYNTLNQSLITSVNVSNSHVYYSVGTSINSENYLSIGSETRPTRSEAGTYTIYYYAPADNYNEISGSVTSIINPKTLDIPVSPASKTYNESFQDSGITCPTGSTESGSTSEINAGSYTQTCTLSSTNNYKWNDNTVTAKNISWTINKSNTGTTGSCNSLTYNTSSQTLMSGGSYVSYSNNSGTNAGNYNVTITTDNNHTFSDGDTSKTQTCTISPKTLTVPTSPAARSYTGGTLYSNITCPTGSNTTGTTSAINAGSYAQTCTLSSTTNYKWNDNTTTAKNISWTIGRLNTATTGSCIARTYTGSSQTIVSSGSYVSYSTTTGVNAGSYSITVTPDSNHTFSDGATSKTLSCSIAKATPTMNLSSTSGTIRIGTNGSITVTGSNYGTLTCGSSNTSIATCSVSGTTVTITPKAVGTATITVYGSGNTNYNSISKTYAATVELGYRCSEGTLTYDATKGASSGGYVCVRNSVQGSTCSEYYTSCRTGDNDLDCYPDNNMQYKCEYGYCYWDYGSEVCRYPQEMSYDSYLAYSTRADYNFWSGMYSSDYIYNGHQYTVYGSICSSYYDSSCTKNFADTFIRDFGTLTGSQVISYGYNQERYDASSRFCGAGPDNYCQPTTEWSIPGQTYYYYMQYYTCVVKYPQYGNMNNGGQPDRYMEVGYQCKTYSPTWYCPSGWSPYSGSGSSLKCYKAATL